MSEKLTKAMERAREFLKKLDERGGTGKESYIKKDESVYGERGPQLLTYCKMRDLIEITGNLVMLTDGGEDFIKDPVAYMRKMEERIEENTTEEEKKGEVKPYHKDGSFSARLLAKDILSDYFVKTPRDSEEIYVYEDGIYHQKGDQFVREEAQNRYPDISTHYVRETKAKVKAFTYIDREEFNPERYIHLENGIYDLEEYEFMDFDPDIVSTTKLPIEYDSEADCPKIKDFIRDLVYDETVPVIQEMFGFFLIKEYIYRRSFMFLGEEGANGKTTLIRLMINFLGRENVSNKSLQELADYKFSWLALKDNLANISDDLPSKGFSRTGIFKKLTGRSPISAPIKHKQKEVQYFNFAKMVFAANNLPKIYKDASDAFWDRWVIIDFPYRFVNKGYEYDEMLKKKDPNKLQKLLDSDELSGLFNWAVEGLKRVREQNGFSVTGTIEDVKERWVSQTDPIKAFIMYHVKEDPENVVPRQDVYNKYKEYCDENGFSSKKKGPFVKAILNQVTIASKSRPEIDGKRVRCFKGFQVVEGKKSLDEAMVNYLDGKEEVHVSQIMDDLGEDFDKTQINNKIVKMEKSGRIAESGKHKIYLVK